MDFKKACSILSISHDFTLTELKRKYYKESLKHHPDKKGDKEKFQEINDAYTFLLNHKNINDHHPIQIMDIIKKILNSTVLYDVLDTLSLDIINHIYDLLPIIKHMMTPEQYELILKYMSNKFNIILLEPTLDDLFQQKIFVYKDHDKTYHIPLWSHEIIFGTYIFKCNPILPDNIQIDESNNIIITLYENIQTVFLKKELEVLHYHINISELYIKPSQTIILKNKGIPIINTENIFYIQLSNIIIHLNLSS
jgi:hypothetical protein